MVVVPVTAVPFENGEGNEDLNRGMGWNLSLRQRYQVTFLSDILGGLSLTGYLVGSSVFLLLFDAGTSRSSAKNCSQIVRIRSCSRSVIAVDYTSQRSIPEPLVYFKTMLVYFRKVEDCGTTKSEGGPENEKSTQYSNCLNGFRPVFRPVSLLI